MLRYTRDGLRPLSDADMQRCIKENLEAVDDHSFGCFVVSTQHKVLMIRPIISGVPAEYWAFPKGHPDDGEDHVAAASRETLEETHVKPDTVRSDVFRTVGYSFIKRMHNDKWVQHPNFPSEASRPILCYHKQVTYYLAEVEDEQAVGVTNETAEVEWVPMEDVLDRLVHDEEKDVAAYFQKKMHAEKSMQCVFYRWHRGKVAVGAVPVPPPPGPGELLIKVHAAALNPVDYKTAAGSHLALLSFEWPRVYGFDFSGTVEAVGAGDTDGGGSNDVYKVGDRVFGMIRGLPQRDRGTLAEYCLVDADICARCPKQKSHIECASLPLVCITAVKMLRACGLAEQPSSNNDGTGPRVLVAGGAGGVGSVAIQIAREMFGASEVVTTASPGAKTDLCTLLGADRVIDYKSDTPWYDSLGAEIKANINKPFDAVLITTNDEVFGCVNAGLVAEGGAVCNINNPPTAESLRTLMSEAQFKPGTVTTGVMPFLSSSLGGWLLGLVTGGLGLQRTLDPINASYHHIVGAGNGEIMLHIETLLEKGKLMPVIDKVYPMDKALDAIAYLEAGHAAGKVVVVVVPESE